MRCVHTYVYKYNNYLIIDQVTHTYSAIVGEWVLMNTFMSLFMLNVLATNTCPLQQACSTLLTLLARCLFLVFAYVCT